MRSLAVLLLLCAPPAFAAAPPAEPPKVWLDLLDRLGSDDDAASKSAEKKLADLGEDVLPLLRKAAKSHADADVRLRALLVARVIRARQWGFVKAFGPGAAVKVYPKGGGYWFHRVILTGDGKYAVVAGGALILYDVGSGKEVGRVLEVGGSRPALDLSKDGKYALTGHAATAEVHLVEIPSLKTARTFAGHKGGVTAVALSPDGKTAASAGNDREVRLWDVKTGKEVAQLPDVPSVVVRLAFSPDGKRLITSHTHTKGGPQLRVFDVATRKLDKDLRIEKDYTLFTSVQISPDGKTAVAGSNHGQVVLWDLESGKEKKTLDNGAYVHDLALSPDGKRALTAGYPDGKVRVWNLAAGELVETFEGHLGPALSVAFSADGRRAASTDTIASVRTWKLGE